MKKTILMSVFALFALNAQAQLTERQADSLDIIATVQSYIDGLMLRDRAKLERAFHPEAKLVGFRGFRYTNTPYKDWVAVSTIGEKRDPEKHQNIIKDLNFTGYAGMVTVEMHWPGIYYFDYLTLLKVNSMWKIVNKTWYETQSNLNN